MTTPRFVEGNTYPTRVFNPTSNTMTVSKVLNMKQLRFEIDPATGKRRSKDGRKQNPNTLLAETISCRYDYFEPLYVKLRAISSTAQNAGMIELHELYPIRPDEILRSIIMLKNARIIENYVNYGNNIFIVLNPASKNFIDKEFAVLHILKTISKKYVDECYYDCVLSDLYGSEHYTADILYREGNHVTFVVTALSQKVMYPAQLERIVRIANRLKSVTIVISPSVNVNELMIRLRNAANSNVSVKLVPYTQLNLL
jgi:hypothetical protein